MICLSGKSFYDLDNRIKLNFIFPYGPNKSKLKENIKKLKFISFFKELNKSIKLIYMKYWGLSKIINKLDTDILISSRVEFANQIHRKDIVTITQEHSYISNTKYMKKCKKAFKDINYLVVMTKQAKNLYESYLKGLDIKIKVIPNMIEENKTGKLSSLENNQIISIGRLEDVKDFKTLINVFSLVQEKHRKLILKIVGEGSQRKNLEGLIKEKNLEENIILTGSLDKEQIIDELLKSDIFVLTSKSESFSLVLCEAMNYGVPCIAFDVDVGPREIIEDGKNGYLIKNRDIIAMENKIEELFENSEKRKKLGNKAFISISRFYESNIKELWEEIFI